MVFSIVFSIVWSIPSLSDISAEGHQNGLVGLSYLSDISAGNIFVNKFPNNFFEAKPLFIHAFMLQ